MLMRELSSLLSLSNGDSYDETKVHEPLKNSSGNYLSSVLKEKSSMEKIAKTIIKRISIQYAVKELAKPTT